MLGFQWIPNTNQYTFYTDSWTKMMVANANNHVTTEFITLSDINNALKISLKNFFGVQFIDSNTILITDNNKFYNFNLSSKSGELIQETPIVAENPHFDSNKINLAFTEKNNLFFLDKNNQRIPITNNTDKNIVSGQAIARSEFGISNGIFWSPKSSYIAFYQKDETNVADYPLLDINETPGKLENIKYPMIGQNSEKPKVGIYSLANNKTVYISPKGNSEDYLTNISWTPDEKYILIAEVNREQNNMNLNLYDRLLVIL